MFMTQKIIGWYISEKTTHATAFKGCILNQSSGTDNAGQSRCQSEFWIRLAVACGSFLEIKPRRIIMRVFVSLCGLPWLTVARFGKKRPRAVAPKMSVGCRRESQTSDYKSLGERMLVASCLVWRKTMAIAVKTRLFHDWTAKELRGLLMVLVIFFL